MKFRCDICMAQGMSRTVTAIDYDEGMRYMQQHIDDDHGGGKAEITSATLNVKIR
jgi:hypothetical protein